MTESEEELKKRATRISSAVTLMALPLFFGLWGAPILLWYPADLLIFYNYPRGSPSLVDKSALALLGSDGARMVVWCSCIVGAVIGLLACRPFISILNALRRDGEVLLSARMRLVVYAGPSFIGVPALILLLPYSPGYGVQSRFLSDIALLLMAGYFVAFCFPVLFKYTLLARYAKTTGSRLCLLLFRRDGASRREAKVFLKILHDRPNQR